MIPLRITPPLSTWVTTSSLKPALFLGVAGTSSIALVTSTSRKPEEVIKILGETANKVAEPLSPYSQKILKGTNDLFEQLGSWVKLANNQKDTVINWIKDTTLSGVSLGAKVIFAKLHSWGNSIYDFLKSQIPALINKDSWDRAKQLIKEYGSVAKELLSFLGNIFKGDFDGNQSLLGQLFKAIGNEKFGDFLSAASNLASKHGNVFKEMSGQDFGDLMHAFEQNPDGTTKTLESFAEKDSGKVEKKDVMNALKPSTLQGRIREAIAEATKFTSKGKVDPDDQQKAKAAQAKLQELLAEVKKILNANLKRK